MTDVGYARVSTQDQDPALQVTALEKAGCVRIFSEKASGAKTDRPELARALDYVRPGDTLVVWKLDRLGRSLSHLLTTVNSLAERGVEFRSLTEGFDTSTPGGRLVFSIMGALAEFERGLIIERTQAGLAAARAAGRKGGRPVVVTAKVCEKARRLRTAGVDVPTIAKNLGISRASAYRALSGSVGVGA